MHKGKIVLVEDRGEYWWMYLGAIPATSTGFSVLKKSCKASPVGRDMSDISGVIKLKNT